MTDTPIETENTRIQARYELRTRELVTYIQDAERLHAAGDYKALRSTMRAALEIIPKAETCKMQLAMLDRVAEAERSA